MYLDNAASWRGLDYLKDELGCRCKFDSLKVELGIRLRHFRTPDGTRRSLINCLDNVRIPAHFRFCSSLRC